MRDFLAPLERLPRLAQPKEDGQLGFTKTRVALRPTEQLVVGGGPVGFTLRRPPKLPAIHPGWTVVATLRRVDGRGKDGRFLGYGERKVRTLGRGKGGGLALEAPTRPGPYRLEVQFRSRGFVLSTYGFYFLVVKPFKDRRLALDATAYRPGQTVFGRVENFGTMTTAYGVEYGIERLDGSQWSVAPESPTGPWIMLAAITGPGKTGPCFPFQIPATMPAGHYRMSKQVDGLSDVSRATTLTAEFDVLP